MTIICLVGYLVSVFCHYLFFVTYKVLAERRQPSRISANINTFARGQSHKSLFTLALLWALADIPFVLGMMLISR